MYDNLPSEYVLNPVSWKMNYSVKYDSQLDCLVPNELSWSHVIVLEVLE